MWLVPGGDGTWMLKFLAERPDTMPKPDLQALLDRAWGAGFAVYDCDRHAEVRSVDELGWSDGCYVLLHNTAFPSREAAEKWIRTNGGDAVRAGGGEEPAEVAQERPRLTLRVGTAGLPERRARG